MSTEDTRSLVAEYNRFLRSFGLSLSEIADLHGLSSQTALDPNATRAALRGEDGRITMDRLHRQLLEVLGRSSRGFTADRQYWNRLPTVQLGEVLGTAGYQFGVRTRTAGKEAVCSTDDAPIDLGIWQPEGGPVSHTTFEYPETPLGDDNYPALVATVNEELLDGTGLTIVLCDDRVADWQFLLLPSDLLGTLCDRYGDRIEWRGRPLLCESQPVDFEDGLPASFDPDDVTDSTTPDEEPTIPRPETTFEELSVSTQTGTDAGAFDHGDADEPSAESLASAADPTDLVTDGSGSTGPALDPVSQQLTEGIGQAAAAVARPGSDESSPPHRAEWHTEPFRSPAAPDDVDEVFERLERKAAAEPVDDHDGDDHYVSSSEVLDAVEHENVGDHSRFEDGFLWVDPGELTAAPWAVHDAMTRG